MPKQNRVDPWGKLVATPAKGTLMGNRGRLHDANQEIKRHYAGQRWLFCQLHYKSSSGGYTKRRIMDSGSYTELFFLDEATALAAGHRPCNDCDPKRLKEFFKYWAEGNPDHIPEDSDPTAKLIDPILHEERWDPTLRTKRLHRRAISAVPCGSIVLRDSEKTQPYLVTQYSLIPWTFEGYGHWIKKPEGEKVWALTPPSIMNTFKVGFKPRIHPSILDCV